MVVAVYVTFHVNQPDVEVFLSTQIKYGDERRFVAKKVLPSPIALDDSEEDECISVVRYKILLEPRDTTSSFAPRDELGRVIGWISDRGRLADDSYSLHERDSTQIIFAWSSQYT